MPEAPIESLKLLHSMRTNTTATSAGRMATVVQLYDMDGVRLIDLLYTLTAILTTALLEGVAPEQVMADAVDAYDHARVDLTIRYSRPATAEENSRAQTQIDASVAAHEAAERKKLAELVAKYGVPK